MCHRFGGWVNFDADPDLFKGRDMIMFEKVKQFSYGNQPNDRYTLDKINYIAIFGILKIKCLNLKYFLTGLSDLNFFFTSNFKFAFSY